MIETVEELLEANFSGGVHIGYMARAWARGDLK
jgi:hypothetical protein